MSSLTALPPPFPSSISTAQPIPIVSTSIAASIDSFYRSGMNSFLNRQLVKNGNFPLFPNMHLQLPVRVMYINGMKNLRAYMMHLDSSTTTSHSPMKLGMMAILPGVVMTPFISFLEASNVGHINREAIWIRWTRGLVPRLLRESIFAMCLNQISDHCTTNYVPDSVPAPMKPVAGSIIAGIFCGYVTQFPHNMSALKLMNPELAYSNHLDRLIHQALKISSQPPVLSHTQWISGLVLIVLRPRGFIIRTTQIVGSFMIINGLISVLESSKKTARI